MLFCLGAETKLINMVDDLAQVISAGNLVFDFSEYLSDLVFNCVWPTGFLFEAVEVGKELLIDKVAQVIACQSLVMVKFAVLSFRCRP